jgi:hypothetical protein
MNTLKIAIQKSGRLHDESIQLLKDCGISVYNGNDQLKVTASNFPLEVYYLRNSDIPQYLLDGVVDIAIVGDNLLVEKGQNIIVAFLAQDGPIDDIETYYFHLDNINLIMPHQLMQVFLHLLLQVTLALPMLSP